MDLVVNHTSDEHAWFIEAKKVKIINTEIIMFGAMEWLERFPMACVQHLAALHGNLMQNLDSTFAFV